MERAEGDSWPCFGVILGTGMHLGGLIWKEMDTAGKCGCLAGHGAGSSPRLPGGVSPIQGDPSPACQQEETAADSGAKEQLGRFRFTHQDDLGPSPSRLQDTLLPPTLMSRFGQSCFSRGVRDGQPRESPAAPGKLCLSTGFQGSSFDAFHHPGKEFDNEFGAKC